MRNLNGDGSMAYGRARWSCALQPSGAEALSESGKILIVFEKHADGAWLTVADAWNPDLSVRM